MTVKAADLAELQKLEQAMPEHGGIDLSGLQTAAELYAWLITTARADHESEGDTVELFARHSGATAREVRDIAAVLRRLGYRDAADRLSWLAGQRRHDLRPLP
jgi:hypothetical protein